MQACSPYDPRIRPWYVAATSGPKDVVIVIDSSGSMSALSQGQSKMEQVIHATKAVLQTLTFSDYVAVVEFSSSACTKLRFGCGERRMVQATATNIQALTQALERVDATGSTCFDCGFSMAFDILSQSRKVERSSGCNAVIMFLTDGKDSDRANPPKVLKTIADGQKALGSRPATIFTYSMGAQSDSTSPKRIACDNNGIWRKIHDHEDPLTAMSQYFTFLAAGLRDHEDVRWTEPYMDSSGLGRMVTAAQPVHDNTGALVGVVGTDLLMSDLENAAKGQ